MVDILDIDTRALVRHIRDKGAMNGIISSETTDVEVLKERLNQIYSKHTGKSLKEISQALERDKFMTAQEAKDFGLIDSVVEKRK